MLDPQHDTLRAHMNPGQLLRSLCAILLLGSATSAFAGPNDACLKCHTDASAKARRRPGRCAVDPAALRRVGARRDAVQVHRLPQPTSRPTSCRTRRS
ncbi:MAG: hypothetical protein M0C28_11500 [Candidatus Moduliflexus flocculans]|nr:hypothetical protein [Candidatus Moduliflexus flocculans]